MKEALAPFFISNLPELLLSGSTLLFIGRQFNRTSTAPEPRKRPKPWGATGVAEGLFEGPS